jgi:hypothetical protein
LTRAFLFAEFFKIRYAGNGGLMVAEIALHRFADSMILTALLSQNFRLFAGRELPPGSSLV